ncbi:phage scaffolding protein [Lentilactobacillus sp. Marseille-Q4993]|uniref:phage scaffolding protein n=1 Tax=Lentilactobacillus sp. Marseille-Q4993 TaxID=3039492 RepID=UPI0024BCBC41|nr:phage scaffolding protein [Lentilactobacillus sp. Marseille-Q4993]
MKREQLKELELSDEQIEKIMSLNGADIEKAKSGSDTLQQENESLKTQISERDKDLKGLQKQVKDNAELSSQLEEWQTKYKTDTETLTNELQQTKLNGALNNALASAKVRNPKAAEALLDMDNIKLTEDGQLEGLDGQIAELKKTDAYLFDEGNDSTYQPQGGNGSKDTSQVQTLVDIFNPNSKGDN